MRSATTSGRLREYLRFVICDGHCLRWRSGWRHAGPRRAIELTPTSSAQLHERRKAQPRPHLLWWRIHPRFVSDPFNHPFIFADPSNLVSSAGHAATISTLSYAIRFWSKGTKRALFLRHEGYLGGIGAWLKNLDPVVSSDREGPRPTPPQPASEAAAAPREASGKERAVPGGVAMPRIDSLELR